MEHTYPHNFQDLTGRKFNRLTVQKVGDRTPSGKIRWQCLCDCGNVTLASSDSLKSGNVSSCGCYQQETKGLHSITHGESRNKRPSPELRSFQTAKARCNNPTDAAYARYGGRGIKFLFDSFEQFLNEIGRKPTPKHSLDRINVDGNYEPGNVRWADEKTQQRNRRNNIVLEYNGVIKTASEWAADLGLKNGAVQIRIGLNWCTPCAVTLPSGSHCPHRPPVDRWTTRRLNAARLGK